MNKKNLYFILTTSILFLSVISIKMLKLGGEVEGDTQLSNEGYPGFIKFNGTAASN